MNSPKDVTPGQLGRTMKPQWVFAMALGSAVGWGAFILPFDWLQSGGLAGTLLGFLIGGAMIALIAVNYGLIIRALPVTGGGLAFALAALGRTHGFIAGWCLMLGYAGIVALNASAVTLVFRVTVPGLVMRGKLYSVAGWDVYLVEVIIATAFLLGFALLNIRGMEASGFFQYLAVVLLIAAVALVSAGCVLYLAFSGQPLAPAFPSGVSPWAAVAAIVAIAPWAYVGFDTVPQLAGEFNFSPRKALSLLMWGVAVATFIYAAMSLATAIAVGRDHDTYADYAWPPAAAILDVIGPAGMILMVIAVSMGVLTGLNGFYASASRVILTMGRARMLPPGAAHISASTGAPTVAIWATTALCLITPWFGRAALSWVVDMTSVGITVAYLYTCYCSYRVGRTGFVPGMRQRQEPDRAQEIYGIVGCLLSVVFLALLLVPGSPGMLGTESLVAMAVWLVAGVAFYLLRRPAILGASDEEIERAVFR